MMRFGLLGNLCKSTLSVMPGETGIQSAFDGPRFFKPWIPACAGMTNFFRGSLVFLLVGPLASVAQAMTVVNSDVQHENGSYRVSFEFTVDAPSNRVRALMSDFSHYDRLVASITEITVVERAPSGRTRLKLVINDCLLFFCRSLTRIEDIVTEPNGDIVTTVLPEHSDFSYAVERWRIVPNGNGTRVSYNAQLTPSIFIPPLIGPIAVKYKIRTQLEETASTLETLARDVTGK